MAFEQSSPRVPMNQTLADSDNGQSLRHGGSLTALGPQSLPGQEASMLLNLQGKTTGGTIIEHQDDDDDDPFALRD